MSPKAQPLTQGLGMLPVVLSFPTFLSPAPCPNPGTCRPGLGPGAHTLPGSCPEVTRVHKLTAFENHTAFPAPGYCMAFGASSPHCPPC